jgi:glucosamine-6-phosphate deaminase
VDLQITTTPLQASLSAAALVQNLLRGVDNPVMMLPTGNTPRQLYQELVSHSHDHISWSEATVFALDEYLGVPSEDPRSFRFQLWGELCSPLGLSPSQLISPNGMAQDPAGEALRYEQQLIDRRPISLCVLGVGRNGHIAFNEPGSSPQSPTHVATLSESTRADNQALFAPDQVPTHALTVGISSIMASDHILLLACGAAKAQAVEKLIAAEPDPAFPVTFLSEHPHLTVIIDDDARGESNP